MYFDVSPFQLPNISDILQTPSENHSSKWACGRVGAKTQNRHSMFQSIDVIDFAADTTYFADMLRRIGMIKALRLRGCGRVEEHEQDQKETHATMLDPMARFMDSKGRKNENRVPKWDDAWEPIGRECERGRRSPALTRVSSESKAS